MHEAPIPLLVLGIGNVLMGDEGVGVHVVRRLEASWDRYPHGAECLDGGHGQLSRSWSPCPERSRVVIIDATVDGQPRGHPDAAWSPRYSSDYPKPTLTAHDIGLKDLLDAFYLLGESPQVTLFAISIEFPQPLRLGLSPALQRALPAIVNAVRAELPSPVAA